MPAIKRPRSYEIETPSGGRVTFSASQVEEVIVKSDVLKRYEEFLPKVANTLEGHWDMAERCRKAGLKPQRELHMRKVLEFEPRSRRGATWFGIQPGRWSLDQDGRVAAGRRVTFATRDRGSFRRRSSWIHARNTGRLKKRSGGCASAAGGLGG